MVVKRQARRCSEEESIGRVGIIISVATQHNIVQHSAIQYGKKQYSTLHYN